MKNLNNIDSVKIGDLEKDACGECPIIDHCGEPFSEVHFCCDRRFKDITVGELEKGIEDLTIEECERKSKELDIVEEGATDDDIKRVTYEAVIEKLSN